MRDEVLRRGRYLIPLLLAFQVAAHAGGCEGIFDNTLRFGSPRADAVEAFREATRRMGERVFDGSVAPPVNVVLESRNDGLVMEFDVGSIGAQSKDVRRLFRDLVHRGRTREFGAALIEYADGGTRVAKFTSNRPAEIAERDVLAAIFGAVDRTRPVERLVVLHTHPMLADEEGTTPVICPSTSDYDFAHAVQVGWEALHPGREIEVVGIVLPIIPICADVFFRYWPGGLSRLHTDE